MHAGHHGDPGRMAGRGGAVGVGEGDGLFREALEIGRDHPRVLCERRDIVIEIVDRNEQDVRVSFVSCCA